MLFWRGTEGVVSHAAVPSIVGIGYRRLACSHVPELIDAEVSCSFEQRQEKATSGVVCNRCRAEAFGIMRASELTGPQGWPGYVRRGSVCMSMISALLQDLKPNGASRTMVVKAAISKRSSRIHVLLVSCKTVENPRCSRSAGRDVSRLMALSRNLEPAEEWGDGEDEEKSCATVQGWTDTSGSRRCAVVVQDQHRSRTMLVSTKERWEGTLGQDSCSNSPSGCS